MNNISIKASPSFQQLSKKVKLKNREIIQELTFFEKGREALLFGLDELKIDKNKKILIPGYICSSMTNPLLRNGFKIIYYDINKDFSLNIDKLKKLIKYERISVLIIVHYFGILTEIDEIYSLCRLNNIEIIEDFCHSFLTRFANKQKDFSKTTKIYSIRKNLPIIDGGALENKNFESFVTIKIQSIKFKEILFLILRFIESSINTFGIPNLYGNVIRNLKIKINKSNRIHKINSSKKEVSKIKNPSYMLFKYLNSSLYLKNISERRRNNFYFLQDEINKIGLNVSFFSILHNSVPQFLPILLNDKNQNLFNELNNNGIETIRWPDYEIPSYIMENKNNFPNSIFLNKNIILIPVHQDLTKENCKKIIKVISSFLKMKRLNNN
tara:strand:+ start:15159 stop:16307 length:1149 start_codon:yes stop_codon:yes gene_type:complete